MIVVVAVTLVFDSIPLVVVVVDLRCDSMMMMMMEQSLLFFAINKK